MNQHITTTVTQAASADLVGLVHCGMCHQPMTSDHIAGAIRVYRCWLSRCPRRTAVDAAMLEAIVARELAGRVPAHSGPALTWARWRLTRIVLGANPRDMRLTWR